MTADQFQTISNQAETMSRYRSAGDTPRERHDATNAKRRQDAARVVEVGVPMRDGVVLAADIYFPDNSRLPAPAVVCVNTGYDKSGDIRLTSPLTGRPDGWPIGFSFPWTAPLFQQNGYVFVINDERGRGKSGGEQSDVMRAGLPGQFGDGPDAYDLIEWVAQQPWCNGNVATTGGSMLGNSQYMAAFEKPPHLVCILPIAAGGLWLSERTWENGCYELYSNVSMTVLTGGRLMNNVKVATTDWQSLLTRLPLDRIFAELDDHGPVTEVLHHDTLDEWWEPRLLDGKRRELTVPALHIAGWLDHHQTRGMLKGYEWSRESPAADRQWLIVGPWTHFDAIFHPGRVYQGRDFGADAAVELDQIQIDWYDRWLRGEEASWSTVPKVQLFETGTNLWRSGDTWPLPGGDEMLYLTGADAALSPTREESASTRSFRYDPMDPVMPRPWESPGPELFDQGYLEGRADVLRYTTPPLAAEVATSGWPRLAFIASSDCDDTEWHVRLADVDPDGVSVEIAWGCLRASYRESLSNPTPLTHGQRYEFEIELTPITHAFLVGHAIRVTITSSDFPTYARSLNRFGSYATLDQPRVATNTVHHGADSSSRLILPVTRGHLSGASDRQSFPRGVTPGLWRSRHSVSL